MKKRKSYSAEAKAKAVIAVISGERTVVEVGRELECHPNMIAKWHRAFVEQASAVFEKESDSEEKNRKIAELERMVGKLAVQNEFLKKASGGLA